MFLGLAPCVGASSGFVHTGFLPFREAPFPLLGCLGAWEGLLYGEAPVTGRKYPPVIVQQCQNWDAHKELRCQFDDSELSEGNVLLPGERRLELKTQEACQVPQIVLSLQSVQLQKCFKNELCRERQLCALFAGKKS